MKISLVLLLLLLLIISSSCGQTAAPTGTAVVVNEVITTTLTTTTTATATATVTGAAKPGPSKTPATVLPPEPTLSTPAGLEAQPVLNLGLMVHLEGWNDTESQNRFQHHTELIRAYAALFEKYGAKLTLESKETTPASLLWNDNVFLEMERRGHAVGVHADVGGNASETALQMETKLKEMKSQLESLGVTVRHVSGVCSRSDWVRASAGAGFEFVTGTVAFALASLPAELQPIKIPPEAQPAQFHESYPFTLEGRLHSWRAENGLNWIDDTPTGQIVIIPSGGGLANAYEESQGKTGLAGNQNFTAEDISTFEAQLKQILSYIKTQRSSQPYTYYLSWSFGKTLDQGLMEQWLQMVDQYVDGGQVRWQTIPAMYDEYLEWGDRFRTPQSVANPDLNLFWHPDRPVPGGLQAAYCSRWSACRWFCRDCCRCFRDIRSVLRQPQL